MVKTHMTVIWTMCMHFLTLSNLLSVILSEYVRKRHKQFILFNIAIKFSKSFNFEKKNENKFYFSICWNWMRLLAWNIILIFVYNKGKLVTKVVKTKWNGNKITKLAALWHLNAFKCINWILACKARLQDK